MSTTTLQALVNLKRPSIRLTPLTLTTDDSTESHHAHGLEFEFDCDAAKCLVSVRAVQPSGTSTVALFERTVEGGFARTFKYEENDSVAVLELDKLDVAQPNAAETLPETATPSAAPAVTSNAPTTAAATPNNAGPHTKKRLSVFHFRRRSAAAGPALQVVDADAEAAAARRNSSDDHDDDDHHSHEANGNAALTKDEKNGVKLVIRLEALDEQGSGSANGWR